MSLFHVVLARMSLRDEGYDFQGMRVRMMRKEHGMCVANLAWLGFTPVERKEFDRAPRKPKVSK